MTNRRTSYYAHKIVEPAEPQGNPVTVTGADAIADVLGIEAKQVYRLYDAQKDLPGGPPIKKVAGLGLSGDLAALRAWRAKALGVAP